MNCIVAGSLTVPALKLQPITNDVTGTPFISSGITTSLTVSLCSLLNLAVATESPYIQYVTSPSSYISGPTLTDGGTNASNILLFLRAYSSAVEPLYPRMIVSYFAGLPIFIGALYTFSTGCATAYPDSYSKRLLF